MERFTGRQYLQIDIANNFGLDKKTWAERLSWFQDNEDHLMDLVPKADEPALYYAGVKAYQAVLRGEPIGYAISLDATSSGLQILAALTGDRQAAQLCNVVNDQGKRADAYTIIYEKMLSILGEGSKIKRDDTKRAIMTSLYGSQAVPKEVFGEGLLLKTFLEVMKEHAPAAWELNEHFLKIWDEDAILNSWVLPDNFHVNIKVMTTITESVHFLNEPIQITRKVNAPTKEGRSLGANTIHSIDGMIVREMVRRCDYDPNWIELLKEILRGETSSLFVDEDQKREARQMVHQLWDLYLQSGYLSARILDYLDSNTIEMVDKDVIQQLIDSLPAKPFKLMTIHDCFRCLPQYGNDLRQQYNNQLYLIAKSNMLSFLLSQLVHANVEISKLDPDLPQDILESDYSLS